MKRYKKKIEQYNNLIQEQYIRESSVQAVIDQCKDVRINQEDMRMSHFEFLYAQSQFIKKRWWVLQGCVLILLWLLMKDSGSTGEIERASFYSLRQICAARTFLFAIVDLIKVTLFFVITFSTIQISAYTMIINFFIPFNVSVCICFRLLNKKWSEKEYIAVILSTAYSVLWSVIVMQDSIYQRIAEPIWIGLLLLSFGYLIFCIRKSQFGSKLDWGNTNGIKLKNVSKNFNSVNAVESVTYSMKKGVHGLLGVNGAGKTTLMRMLCTVIKPTCGEIMWNGKNIFELGAAYRDTLGYLPQEFGYYPDLSIYDYMIYIASIKGIRPIAARKRTEQLLQQVGMSKYKKRKMKTLSGGMVRRVGIAQAMLNNSKILVLDEPTEQAVKEKATLEDAFLLYFGERADDNVDTEM